MGFRLKEGNIARAETDVIVNAWNRNYIPYWLLVPAGVAGALRKVAGRQPFRQVSREGLLPLGEAVPTSSGELDACYIVHSACLHWYWSASETSVTYAAENVFGCVEALDVDDVAIPLLGAGTGGLEPATSLEIIREAWRQSSEQLPTEVWIYGSDLYERLTSKE